MTVIKQGAEPVAFKSYFVAWEPQMWNKKMSYEDQMKAIKQDNDKVDENAWSLVCRPSQLSSCYLSRHATLLLGEALRDAGHRRNFV